MPANAGGPESRRADQNACAECARDSFRAYLANRFSICASAVGSLNSFGPSEDTAESVLQQTNSYSECSSYPKRSPARRHVNVGESGKHNVIVRRLANSLDGESSCHSCSSN